MSHSKPSRATLATLLVLVDASEWSDRVKTDVRSAVKTVGRILGGDLAAIEADVASLRRRLEALSPESVGLTKGRWNNIRSLFGKALALAVEVFPSRSKEPVLPEWAKILAPLSAGRRSLLTPLARFLGSRGVLPSDVTVADLGAYHKVLISDRLRSDPDGTWNSIIWSWNACVREFDAWPQIEIERVSRKETYILPWEDLSADYRADCEDYLQRLAKVDPSDDNGPLRPARPATIETRRYQLRVMASALILSGQDPASINSIADLVTLEAHRKILDFFLARHGGKTSPQVGQLAGFLRDLAHHRVKVESQILAKFRRNASRLAMKRKGMTKKNRERLSEFDDPSLVARYLGLPERIRQDVERGKISDRSRAVLASIAAAIALEQVAPIRRKNLASLSLKENLIHRGNRLYLVYSEDETKNEIDIEFELPEETVDILAWYVREWRPLFLSEPCDALFPGENGKAKHPNTISKQVTDTIKKYLGIEFNMHLFRHAGGKIFLDAKPGHYEIVKRVLGHKSLSTTTSIYTGAETRSAGQLYAKVINDRRLEIEAELKTKAGKKAARAITTVKQVRASKAEPKMPVQWTNKSGGKA
ncbi:MAG: site-specific integrase [Alphaproteobacteria bacterium]|nr:site-specific integrase [Alphaproteobacteria bacterium]